MTFLFMLLVIVVLLATIALITLLVSDYMDTGNRHYKALIPAIVAFIVCFILLGVKW